MEPWFWMLLGIPLALIIGWWALRGASPKAPPLPSTMPLPPADDRLEVTHLIAAGQMVAAVKLVRERTGLGLKESKRMVDTWNPGD